MASRITVVPLWKLKEYQDLKDCKVVWTVKASRGWQRQLSPFILGPCSLYADYTSKNMENAWQFSKVYPEHVEGKRITKEYWKWAKAGWTDDKAHRYPMGKGRSPLFSLWDGERLDYLTARKKIYGPLYAEAVTKTAGWQMLLNLHEEHKNLILVDFDAYDHRKLGMTLTRVLNNPNKKMGHAFVLAMLLTKDKALRQMELR